MTSDLCTTTLTACANEIAGNSVADVADTSEALVVEVQQMQMQMQISWMFALVASIGGRGSRSRHRDSWALLQDARHVGRGAQSCQ
jgi:hypothetical protein